MEASKKELEKDILFRVSTKRFERSEANNAAVDISSLDLADNDAAIEARLNACGHDFQQTKFMQDLRDINNWDMQTPLKLARRDLVSEFDNAADLSTRQIRQQEIEKKSNAKIEHAVKDSFMWGHCICRRIIDVYPGLPIARNDYHRYSISHVFSKKCGKSGQCIEERIELFFWCG